MNIYWKKVEGGSTQEFAEIEDYIDEDVPVFVPNPRKKVMIRDLFWITHPKDNNYNHKIDFYFTNYLIIVIIKNIG